MSVTRAERVFAWLDRRRILVLLVSVAVAIGGALLATRMAIKSDLTSLLPQSMRSVQDLHAVQARARPFGTVQVVIEARDPALRARAAAALVPRLRTLPPALVQQFATDDGPQRRYGWDHRFLFASLDDLAAARDALRERIDRGTLESNPLYIDLDDEEPAAAAPNRLDELEGKLADAERAAQAPPQWVSKDGRTQLLVVQTTFAGSDATRARQLTDAIRAHIAAVQAEVGPGVTFSLTGNITLTMYEHDSVLDGMALSALLTVGLCALALLWYYRSARVVIAVLWALGVGVAATFAAAYLAIGHLNVMTAFLFAIVIGNGINAGLILIARYLEEIRGGVEPHAAIGRAMAGAARGTLAAMATASIAYASLLITDFRGFRHFGAIAGAGMALTWLTSFTVLPAALAVLVRRGFQVSSKPPALGRYLARLLPTRHLRTVMAFGAGLTLVAIAVAAAYLARDPFLRDWRDLQSSTPEIEDVRRIDARLRAAMDTTGQLAGQAYQVVIAVDRREDVAPLVAQIRADDAARPPARRWTRDVWSLEDLLPAAQPEKLAVLAEIRALIDSPKLQANLSDDERAKLAKLRPPEDLRPVTDRDVPRELAWPFIEKDGSIGKLIVVRGAKRFDSFNVDHRLAFAQEVRAIALPPGARIAGEPLVVADIIETMERDAPKMIVFALAGSILAVVLVLGLRRHGLVTIACGLAGVVVMIAACFVVGLKVHFLDLIALPITIGIGIDYAVNLAARDAQEGERGLPHLLRTTGSAVLLCSYTTAVGYGTLLLSSNGGIRAFGIAALVGEIACVLMALVVAPAWLALLRQRETRRTQGAADADGIAVGGP